MGDGGEGAHGAGQNDHAGRGIAAGGDVGADVGVAEELRFDRGGVAEKAFGELVAACQAELLGEDTEGVFGGDEIDFSDAGVGLERLEHGLGVDRPACTGDRQGEGVGGMRQGVGHKFIIA